ncbi:MAG: DUF2461 domain-containing protein [Oscillospiraceae bacterium]|jgi:uncharacterized protein (TIGR02453 family)|nr:DUF2461 domain-containing protein [Oscillospiraceae bacterium]
MFSAKTLNFLVENRLQNSREWFAEHKGAYQEYVLQPLSALASALAPAVNRIDPLIITEPKVDKAISRIYRDTRFSKDKLLYREEMWLSFKRDKHAYPNHPEFFFVISPGGFLYGCGYYAAETDTMRAMREMILRGDPAFAAAKKAFERQDHFVLDGDCFKRSKYPEQPENLRSWLDRKNICLICSSNDFSLLFSEDLPRIIAEDYEKLEDVYQFFVRAESEAQRMRYK